MMRMCWKILTAFLAVTFLASLAVTISMYYWPSIPRSPQPSEGRIYPLNNHGSFTYMNRTEYALRQECWWTFAICFAALGSIQLFVDPFDKKRLNARE